MKCSKLSKVLSLSFLTFTLIFTNIPAYVADSANTETSIALFAQSYQWIYKVKNGHLYRRKFNATIHQWAGDWELVT